MTAPYQMIPRCSALPTAPGARAVRSTARALGDHARGDSLRDVAPQRGFRHQTWLSLVTAALLLLGCSIEADCQNEACVCAEGATCDFDCVAPPCNIECRDHSDCTGQCANGSCSCADDSHCAFECDAPPCHVDCGSNVDCSGTCANGHCACEADSECHFDCQSGPCHVSCGSRSTCSGECSNGSCACGNDGKCEFTCKDGNCKTTCPSGAQCLLTCAAGNAGSGNCQFDSCSGGVTECTDGKTLACNRSCP